MSNLHATLTDLHSAASYVSHLLSTYSCPQEGFHDGYGIPHAFCGGWEVAVLGGQGSEEIICITTASNRHLRRALLGGSTSSSLSPTDYSFSPTEPIFSSISSLSDADGDEPGIPRLELHAHPKSGVPMTVTVYPVLGVSESGKPIRIDMLQAGEYGPRHLHKQSDPPLLMTLHELPFLNPTEFVRAKLRKCGRCEGDVDDIAWMFEAYNYDLDPNRIPVDEMEDFIEMHERQEVAEVWERYKSWWSITTG